MEKLFQVRKHVTLPTIDFGRLSNFVSLSSHIEVNKSSVDIDTKTDDTHNNNLNLGYAGIEKNLH